METGELPEIIPMWLTGTSLRYLGSCYCHRSDPGFDQVMHESRGFPRFFPRTGKRISITFGTSDLVRGRVHALRESRSGVTLGAHDTAQLRADITHAVQEELEKLGTEVTGFVNESVREGK